MRCSMGASWVWQMYVVDLPGAVENARFDNVLTHTEQAMNCHAVLFVDGECLLCQKSVTWLSSRVPAHHLAFGSLQGATAQERLPKNLLKPPFEGVVLLTSHGTFVGHRALRFLAQWLPWPWWWLFAVAPSWGYGWVARHRMTWFGRSEECVWSPGLKSRVVDGRNFVFRQD